MKNGRRAAVPWGLFLGIGRLGGLSLTSASLPAASTPFAPVIDSSLKTFGTCNMVSEKTGYFLVYIGLGIGIETPG